MGEGRAGEGGQQQARGEAHGEDRQHDGPAPAADRAAANRGGHIASALPHGFDSSFMPGAGVS